MSASSKYSIVDGWLTSTKKQIKPVSPNYIGWDTGYLDDTANTAKQAKVWINRDLGINAQFRHQIFRGFGKHWPHAVKYNITTANDPFWNVRALDSAILEHGGFHSYPVWCSLHQMVLDDIVK